MHGEFDDEELEPILRPRDTELTLGPKLLLGIFSGLALLCALFFGLGYAVGHRGPQAAVLAPPVAEKPKETKTDNGKPKPSATTQGKATKLVASDADTLAATPAAETQEEGRHATEGTVRPALLTQTGKESTPLMVQIAAVSHQEDAEVLQGALRKRGYKVTVSRDPEDNLIHVRIGPFNSRDEAGKWRQKLLNDGYNAIVQQ